MKSKGSTTRKCFPFIPFSICYWFDLALINKPLLRLKRHKISFDFLSPLSPCKTFVTMETYSEELRATWLSIAMTSLRRVIKLSADTSEARNGSAWNRTNNFFGLVLFTGWFWLCYKSNGSEFVTSLWMKPYSVTSVIKCNESVDKTLTDLRPTTEMTPNEQHSRQQRKSRMWIWLKNIFKLQIRKTLNLAKQTQTTDASDCISSMYLLVCNISCQLCNKNLIAKYQPRNQT